MHRIVSRLVPGRVIGAVQARGPNVWFVEMALPPLHQLVREDRHKVREDRRLWKESKRRGRGIIPGNARLNAADMRERSREVLDLVDMCRRCGEDFRVSGGRGSEEGRRTGA